MNEFHQQSSNNSAILTEEDLRELQLTDVEIFGVFIIIVGYLLLMLSAFKDRRRICEQETEYNTTPAQTGLTAFIILNIGMFVLAQVAFNRFKNERNNLCQQETKGCFTPHFYIFLGYLISIFAYSFKVSGFAQLVAEESQLGII